MPKSMYLIIILSIVLIKSETSFAQTLKKELGICGKMMSTVFEIEPKKDPSFTDVTLLDKEFCDNGRYEENANFVISFYNAKDQLVYDKHIFLDSTTVHEEVDKKSGGFKNTKITKGTNSRIIKFPISKEMGEVKTYKIESLEANKTTDKKNIKW